jgi:hypothetical protein
MGNIQSIYCNIRLGEKDLLNHYDVCGAILRKDICNNVHLLVFTRILTK